MKGRIGLLHPLLFAAYPVMYVYSRNISIVPVWDVVLTILGIWAVLALILFGLSKATAKPERLACVLSGEILFFFTYPWFHIFVRQVPLVQDLTNTDGQILTAWVVAAVLLGVILWFIGALKEAPRFLNIAAIALLSLSFVSLGEGMFRSSSLKAPSKLLSGAPAKAVKTKPDIYYIILDGHGSADTIKEFFGHDITPFMKGLEDLGFFVATESHSNYVQTQLSLASSLNLQYLPELTDVTSPGLRPELDTLVDNSQISLYLKSRGYTYIAVGTGFEPFKFHAADYSYLDAMPLPELRNLLVSLTPLARNDWVLGTEYAAKRKRINVGLSNLSKLAPAAAKPRFVVAHFMIPHPPFVFNPDGSAREIRGAFGHLDGSDFYEAGGTEKDYLEGYRAQVAYADNRVLKLVTRITQVNPNAIIILQGDHGSKSHLDQRSLQKTNVREAFSILNAYRVPPSVKASLYPSITPVNSFRAILKGLFEEDIEMLDDKSFYSTWETPPEFTEVTDALKASGP